MSRPCRLRIWTGLGWPPCRALIQGSGVVWILVAWPPCPLSTTPGSHCLAQRGLRRPGRPASRGRCPSPDAIAQLPPAPVPAPWGAMVTPSLNTQLWPTPTLSRRGRTAGAPPSPGRRPFGRDGAEDLFLSPASGTATPTGCSSSAFAAAPRALGGGGAEQLRSLQERCHQTGRRTGADGGG